MAGLTGIFDADFSEFDNATARSITALGNMERAADKASASVDKISDAAPVQRFATSAGSAATALGKVTNATGQTTAGVGKLAEGLTVADKAMHQFGVNIGPTINTLNELGGVLGKTVGQLGAIGTASAVTAAAIGGWNLGRAIAGWLDLDKQIAEGTAALMGWGNVVEQETLAKMDELERASKNAGRAIFDLGEARRINAETAKKHAEALKAYSDAMAEIKEVSTDYKRDLDSINGAVAEAIKFYLDLGVSQKSLAAAYGLTLAQVNAVRQAMDAERESAKAAAEAFKDLVAQYEAHAKRMGDIDKEMKEKGDAERDKAREERNAQTKKAFDDIAAREAELRDLTMRATMETTEYQLAKVAEWERGEIAAIDAIGAQHTRLTELIKAQAQQRREAIAAEAGAWGSVARAMAEIAAGRMGVAVIGGERGTSPTNERVDTQTLIQRGKAGGDAYTVNMNVSGVWDPRTIAQTTDMMSAELYRRSGRKDSPLR